MNPKHSHKSTSLQTQTYTPVYHSACWNYRPAHPLWPRRNPAALERCLRALQPESCHIALGIYGPNSSLRKGSVIKLEISLFLEVKNADPNIPVKELPLGRGARARIKAYITGGALIDPQAGIYLYTAKVAQTYAAQLTLNAPPGYTLPADQVKSLRFPGLNVDFLMAYQPGQPHGHHQGAILSYFNFRNRDAKNAHHSEPTREYVPERFNVPFDDNLFRKLLFEC